MTTHGAPGLNILPATKYFGVSLQDRLGHFQGNDFITFKFAVNDILTLLHRYLGMRTFF